MALIHVSNEIVTLEICKRCYTGCKYCYLTDSVSTDGDFVSLEILKSRILWIKKHTNVQTVYLIGGEPLTHPNFIKICEFILETGLRLGIVTSGKISKLEYEKINFDYLLRLYYWGKIKVELSFHGDRNLESYTKLFKSLKCRYQKRRRMLKQQGLYDESSFDIVGTAVIKFDHTASLEEFYDYVGQIFNVVRWRNLSKESKEKIYNVYLQHIGQKEGNAGLYWQISNKDKFKGFRVRIALVGATEFSKNGDTVQITRPESGTCPATRTEIKDSKVYIPSLHIRTDGGVTYPIAECVDMTYPLMNIDAGEKEDEILTHLKTSIEKIMKMIFFFNRKKAAENCDENGKEKPCTACPFSSMCSACWKLEK